MTIHERTPFRLRPTALAHSAAYGLICPPYPTSLPVCERAFPPVGDEPRDQLRLDVFWVVVGRFEPGHEAARALGQLPDVSPTPVPNRDAGAVLTELIEARRQPSPAGRPGARLADVENVRSVYPSRFKEFPRDGGGPCP